MARNMFHLFKHLVGPNKAPIYAIIAAPHLIYVASTRNEDEIVIHNKYKFTCNGFTNFMIIDQTGKHYNVNNSLWFWKWDSVEDWCKLNKGDKINIQYYGYRIPFLGVFPNIVNTNYEVPSPVCVTNDIAFLSVI